MSDMEPRDSTSNICLISVNLSVSGPSVTYLSLSAEFRVCFTVGLD